MTLSESPVRTSHLHIDIRESIEETTVTTDIRINHEETRQIILGLFAGLDGECRAKCLLSLVGFSQGAFDLPLHSIAGSLAPAPQ